MLNLLLRIIVSFYLALDASKFVSSFMFEERTRSFAIAYYGLTFVILTTVYSFLSKIFATKLMIVDKAELEKQVEKRIKELNDE